MSKLSEIFTNQKAFIGFIVAGDPSIEATVNNILALANGGTDLIEIGIPFSDPVADGPIIAASDKRALDNYVNTDDIFEIVKRVREKSNVPIVFLTYANLVFKNGYDNFCSRCAELNVSGMIIPDMPFEEQDELLPSIEKYNLDLIQLITPTSKERIEKIVKRATGFIYVVSSMGITGERDDFKTDLRVLTDEIKSYTKTPIAIGFGIHTPEQARSMCELSDGVIVGSKIVDLIDKNGEDAPTKLIGYAKKMKNAMKI